MKHSKENKIKFRKSGSNVYCADIAIPVMWLKDSGFEIPSDAMILLEYHPEIKKITLHLEKEN